MIHPHYFVQFNYLSLIIYLPCTAVETLLFPNTEKSAPMKDRENGIGIFKKLYTIIFYVFLPARTESVQLFLILLKAINTIL
jgi:hypothetical protein